MSNPDEKTELGRQWRLLAIKPEGPLNLENEGVFDELAVDTWLHVENLDTNLWFLRVGDARIIVTLITGEQPIVQVERGFFEPPRGPTSTFAPPDEPLEK